MKNKPVSQQTNAEVLPRPLLPMTIIGLGLLVWACFVLSSYLKYCPLDNLLSVFSFKSGGQFSWGAFTPVLFGHLLNILIAFTIFLSAFGLGSLVLSKLSEKELGQGEKYFIYTALGLGIYALALFFSGMLGLLFRAAWITGVIVFGIYGITKIRGFSANALRELSLFEKAALLVLAYTALINLMGALTPELFFDSQFYQLGLLNKWVLNNKIHSDTYIAASFFPFNVNMIYMLGLLLGNAISAKLLHYFFGLLLVYGIYVCGKKFASRSMGIAAALIFYSIPRVMTVNWAAAVEQGIGVFEFAAVYCLIEHYFEHRNEPALNPAELKANTFGIKYFWIIMSGVFCGFSLGSKYTSIAFSFIPCALTIITMDRIMNRNKYSEIAKELLLFGAGALIVCAPWYIRNLIQSGNPVFPFFWQKMGFLSTKVKGSQFADPPYPILNLRNYVLFLWPLTMGTLQQESLLGPVFLVFVPLVFFFKNISKKTKLLLVYCLLSMVMWIVLGRFYVRYFIPTLSLFSLIFAYYIFGYNYPKLLKTFFMALLIFIGVINSKFAENVLAFLKMPMPYILGIQSKHDYLFTMKGGYPNPYYSVVDYANDNIPKDSRILFIGETRGLYSKRRFLTNGVGDYSPLNEWLKQCKDPKELLAKFRSEGITHILLNLPEARRLAGFDELYFEPEELKVFSSFWNRYVVEIHKDIADIALPQKDIFSIKNQQPQWWAQYSADPNNYVYLYGILSEVDSLKPHNVPQNFLLEKEVYSQERWEKIGPIIARLKKYHD